MSQFGTSSHPIPSSTSSLSRHTLIDEFHKLNTHQLLTTTILFILVTICFVHLVIGLEMMDNMGLSDSVSPIVMSFFKYCLVIVTSHSLAHEQVLCRMFKSSTSRKSRFFHWWGILLLSRFFNLSHGRYMNRIAYHMAEVVWIIGGFNGQGEQGWLVKLCHYSFMHIMVFPIGVRVSLSSDLVLVICILTSFCGASSELVRSTTFASAVLCFMDKSIRKLLPVAEARTLELVRILKE